MSKQIYKPSVVILPSVDDVDTYLADILIKQVQEKPSSVLTLPTGSTPLGMYQQMVQAYKAGRVSFAQVTTFNLDEYWPMKNSHHSSYAYYMTENLFKDVDVPVQNRNIPDGEANDATIEAKRYETLLQQHDIDLSIISLGPGKTCHIGFNERGSHLSSRVRYVSLDEETKQANVRFFDNLADMPIGAITQGVADILDAKRILFVAAGTHKAWGVRRSLEGTINSEAPASFLRYHPHVTVVLDHAAASLLKTH